MATYKYVAPKDLEREFGVFKAKWNILARTLRFLGKDKMQREIQCYIILHKMMVGWREAEEGREFSEQPRSEETVGGEAFPVYAINRVDYIDGITPGIAAMCDTAAFTRNVGQYEKIRQLIMDKLWNTLGSIE